ncbi:hypothetical protein GA0115254_12513 [Streptomyces sp. Ncost-T10-10d]|nr:hypothetical protein GA0115254_12513 [Streptomyces sp. Ncost-T10-10d]
MRHQQHPRQDPAATAAAHPPEGERQPGRHLGAARYAGSGPRVQGPRPLLSTVSGSTFTASRRPVQSIGCASGRSSAAAYRRSPGVSGSRPGGRARPMRPRTASSPHSRMRASASGSVLRAPGHPVPGRGPAARRTYAWPRPHRPACRPRAGRIRPGAGIRTRAHGRPGRRPTMGRGRADRERRGPAGHDPVDRLRPRAPVPPAIVQPGLSRGYEDGPPVSRGCEQRLLARQRGHRPYVLGFGTTQQQRPLGGCCVHAPHVGQFAHI